MKMRTRQADITDCVILKRYTKVGKMTRLESAVLSTNKNVELGMNREQHHVTMVRVQKIVPEMTILD